MRILFLHPNFPAQFRHIATALAQNPNNEVVFGTLRQEGELPGVRKVLCSQPREPRPEAHAYLHSTEKAVLMGQAAYRMAAQLKAEGFVPDVIYGSSGWGLTLFMKDIFPQARLHCYFEWFYHAHGSDVDFDRAKPVDVDLEASLRIKNMPILSDLWSCDRGLSPTYWQRSQFPSEFHSKITVLHDGIDTTFFKPKPERKLVLPQLGLDLSHVDEIVTYTTRGMEPYRGFPQFMEAIALLQERRPNCHVVIAGEDRVCYGKPLPDGKTYKQLMLETLPLELSRIHFTGSLPYEQYLQVLQASSAHVYLTYPFVLSWSMLEAMATGCLVIASGTEPVTEVIQNGYNGLLIDFYSPASLVEQIDDALEHPEQMEIIRTQARETILRSYDLKNVLPQHLKQLQGDSSQQSKIISLHSHTRSYSKGFAKC
ncbi:MULTISPECIES: glycosyltransferase family 4 protein [unclassified Leptolyngbya]|uniref:glycosyltransferase family 4 protein n=1 Tax=unclassified Leptolyngbya TaxID=2650499 RepID=UPI001685EC35|nr:MULTISPECIES: glycosyltransferase family 4 protein [unclassified Leptolyngbya]MBD1913418.1 glycosyltransferase [Leptolyngbya sp. FACHB-8]MBD2155813.1 glycosyltransferase [Leptolyngbya sp. FACHB-16]